MRRATYAAIFLLLAIGAWQLRSPICILFLCISGYHVYQGIRGPRSAVPPAASEEPAYGEVKRFLVEGDNLLGLYLRLADSAVFVDIREDNLLEGRRTRAMELSSGQDQLNANLSAFVREHAEFASRRVASLGIHAPDLQRTEVFWTPTGYTLIRGLSFELG